MAGDIATRYVRIRPDTSGFKQETDRQVASALKGVKRTIAATLGGAGIYEVLKSTFEAAAGRQSAGAAVELAVKNAGAAWVVYGKTVEQILEEQEHSKGFDFEEQAQAFGRIEQQTKNTKQSIDDLNLAMDVSRGRHLQLAQVATALAKLEGGNAQSLQRLGIITDKYSGSQDALKSRIADVNAAIQAQTASHQKNYDGQLKLTAAQTALLGLSKSELKQREAGLKAQLTGAAASDKQITTDRARAELLRRYGGQAETFAHTASGQLAILHTSIQQLQESIGTAFLPLLSQGAKDLGDWANSLANSASFQDKLATGAHDVGAGLQAIGTGIHAVEPLLGLLQDLVDLIGVGPIVAFVAAWRLLPPVLALAGTGEAALSADTKALQASLAGVGTQLDAFAAQVAAVGGAEVAATVSTEGLTAAEVELMAAMDANIATTETLLAVTEEQAVASKGAAVGLAGMLGPLALLAGAVYFLHEQFDTANTSGADFKTTVDKLAEATRLAKTDVAGAAISRDQAQSQRDQAQIARDTAAARVKADQNSSVSAGRLATDQDALRDTTLSLRSATHAYAIAIDEVTKREAERKKGIADQATALADLTTQVTDTADASRKAATFLASHGGDFNLGAIDTKSLEIFTQALDKLADENPSMQTAIDDLKGIAEATHKIPDKVTIGIVLNPSLNGEQLTDQIVAQLRQAQNEAQGKLTADGGGFLGRGGLKALPVKTGADFAKDFIAAGGVYPGEVKTKVKKDAAAAAQTFSTEFVQHIDVGGIADAISSALEQARSNIATQSDAIASAVGDALDERLRRTTLPLTREITALQASLDAESAANAASDAADAVTVAQRKLDELRSVYGTGALTAGQSGEISDAEKALADAQRQIADNAKQARIKSLQGQIDAAGKAEDLRKTAVTRNLADLADEFNRGKISQQKYVEDVHKVLAGQSIGFKSAGKLLGEAFADGFSDSLKNLQSQVLALTGGQRKGSTLTKPTSVTKAGADAMQAVLDQIAGSSGRFTLDNIGKLPKGVNVAGLVSAAQAQRAEESYRVNTTKHQEEGLTYAQETNRHLERITTLLRDGTHVVVSSDGSAKKKTRSTAKATHT